ncbi:MAG TPA: 50S ribosomal protein L32 [Myxococcales bacterium]|jgi:large subunit ribosomal protein L32|nr:50S ribosomal protein L32 [Myxococcales bacterium]HIL02764.1 50S ribosomal protein L32 [Myxococcales bacterium]
MAVPKQKTSKARRDKRRSHDGLATPPRSTCPQCGAPKVPHRICGSCGSYKGRTLIETDQD